MDIVFFVGKKHIDPLNVDFEFEKYLSILLINEVYLTPQKIVGINLINLLKKNTVMHTISVYGLRKFFLFDSGLVAFDSAVM